MSFSPVLLSAAMPGPRLCKMSCPSSSPPSLPKNGNKCPNECLPLNNKIKLPNNNEQCMMDDKLKEEIESMKVFGTRRLEEGTGGRRAKALCGVKV